MTIQSNDTEYRNTDTSHYPDTRQSDPADIITADRSAEAEVTVEAFIAQTGQGGIEDVTISDLIADIGHLCDANDIDYLATIRQAIGHYYVNCIGYLRTERPWSAEYELQDYRYD